MPSSTSRSRKPTHFLALAFSAIIFTMFELMVRLIGHAPPELTRFALADVAAGAYVHRRDSTAGPWLEVVGDRVSTRQSREREGISPLDVPARPQPGVVRVVALGGSTTRGVPFDHIGDGVVHRTERALDRLRPDQAFEVINLGVPGMDARGVAALAREARALHPHLWLVYTGNN